MHDIDRTPLEGAEGVRSRPGCRPGSIRSRSTGRCSPSASGPCSTGPSACGTPWWASSSPLVIPLTTSARPRSAWPCGGQHEPAG